LAVAREPGGDAVLFQRFFESISERVGAYFSEKRRLRSQGRRRAGTVGAAATNRFGN
jgi:hypothetical protein